MIKKNLPVIKIFLLTLSLLKAGISPAQQTFTVISSRENNYCNSTCTLFDNPDLNGNSGAIIFVTPQEGKGGGHPICVYYINKKWSVINTDNASMTPGSQFNVEYYPKPDDTHFVHVMTRENSIKDRRSYIDHIGLNNNPAAQFRLFQSWSPSVWGGMISRNEIKVQYDAAPGKWYISNVNEKQLDYPVAYNIIISGDVNTVVSPVKEKGDILLKEPVKTMPVDKGIVINKPVSEKQIDPGKVLEKAYDFSNVHICLDQSFNGNLPPRKPLPKIPKLKSNGEIETVSSIGQELSVVTSKMWSPGTIITVGFFPADATPNLISKVKTYAKVWETYANIKFLFVPFVDTANVKVGFKPTNQSWSWLGRDVMFDTLNLPTVNFGWFNDQTDENEFRRVIIHEFGHVLGFIHEHSSPAAGIPWDKDKVYSYFLKHDGWGTSMVDSNIFKKYSMTETNSSSYDRQSIMHYFFPPELVTDGSVFTNNTNLSTTDMQFARQVYPFPSVPPTATGTLLTGDDCDEIRFKVEYDVVGSSDVEFVLSPGYDPNGNLITWWKAITIPEKGGQQDQMEMQDGYTVRRTIAANSIDRTRGITFGKAKILGVHTGLTYTWNPWPAILPRCRVTLTWQRDKCGGL